MGYAASSQVLPLRAARRVRHSGRRVLTLALIGATVLALLCAGTAAGYVNWIKRDPRAHVIAHTPIEMLAGPGELLITDSVRQIEVDLLAGHSASTPTGVSTHSVVGLMITLNEDDAGKLRCNEPVDVSLERYAGHIYHGQVVVISSRSLPMATLEKAAADPAVRVRAVRIEIEDPEPTWQPGAVGNAAITPQPAVTEQSAAPESMVARSQ